MAHTVLEKTKLLDRVRRIKGQIEVIERALEAERDSYLILQTVAACRGALNGLMGKIIEGHVRFHVLDPKRKVTAAQTEASQELIDIVRTFLK